MTQPAVREPVYPGSQAVQVPYKAVSIISVDKVKRKCLVRDGFGVMLEIRCDIMRAKGNLPEAGEQWIIDRQYGDWVLGAIMTGGTEGVTVPQENVHGLPEIITSYDERMTGIADTALANDTTTNQRVDQTNTDLATTNTNLATTNTNLATTNTNLNSLESRTLGRTLTKGDLLATTSTGVVARQQVGTNGQVLVADSTQATGLTYRTPLALTAPLTGATSAVRYVGGTSSGPPTTGTFAAGDHITTLDGNLWLCTVAGTPGTWVQSAPGAGTVDGSKLAYLAGCPALLSTVESVALRFQGGVLQSVNTAGSAYAPMVASQFTANNGVMGTSGGRASFVSAADGAGVQFFSGEVRLTNGTVTNFVNARASGYVLSSVTGSAALGAVAGSAAFYSSSGNAGIKLETSAVLVTTGDGGAFGPIKATAFTPASSRMLKQQIRPFELPGGDSFVDGLMRVAPKKFKFNSEVARETERSDFSAREHIGFIAEEVVMAHPDLLVGSLDDPENAGLDVMSLIAFLWGTNQELVKRVRALEARPVEQGSSSTNKREE